METLISIAGFIVVLSVLVLVHELGHFLAALWAKVQVDEFGLGYPPKIYTFFKRGTTAFTLNLIPLGGFVRMVGEEITAEDTKEKLEKGYISFAQASVWQQLMIICAGVTFNFIFGIAAFILVFSQTGIPTAIQEPRIGLIQEGSPAQEAGVQLDTAIRGFRVEGSDELKSMTSVEQVMQFISQNTGKKAVMVTSSTCTSASQCPGPDAEYEVYFRTDEEKPEGHGSLGVGFDQVWFDFYPWPRMLWESTRHGFLQAYELAMMINHAVASMLRDALTLQTPSQELAGPVGIVHQAQQVKLFESNWITIVSYMGMLSINLGVMNLLPISPLDGGRAVFIILIEFFGKKRVQKIDEYVTFAGYLLLLSLILSITARDIYRLF